MPGVPDIYQGSELGDFSLVDPDNRRAVDFDAAAAALDAARPQGLDKIDVLAAILPIRRRYPQLFAAGSYEALPARGYDGGLWFAFMRREGAARMVVVTSMRGVEFAAAVERQTTATLELPEVGGGWRAVFSGADFADGATLLLPRDVADRPVEVLLGT